MPLTPLARTLLLLGSILLLCILAGCSAFPGATASPVVIEWTTATEVDTAGFNLYRSESPDGPFVQINSELIPASGQALTGSKYRYEDSEAMPGRTYYYQLEDVEFNGTTTKHPPAAVSANSALPIPSGYFLILLVVMFGVIGLGIVLTRGRAGAPAN